MQGAGHQAFAGARLTGEEHGWYLVQRGDLARPLEHRADGRRVAQHSLEPDVPGGAPAVVGQLLLQQELRSEEHTSELQSRLHLVCRLLLEKKKKIPRSNIRTKSND